MEFQPEPQPQVQDDANTMDDHLQQLILAAEARAAQETELQHSPQPQPNDESDINKHLQHLIHAAETRAAEENQRTTRSQGRRLQWNPEMNQGPILMEDEGEAEAEERE